MSVNFVSTGELARDVIGLVPFCLDLRVSAIYGVPRSGMLPASMLATALQVPLGMAGSPAREGRRVTARPRRAGGPALLLDDSVNHGGSMRAAAALMGDRDLLRACVYVLPGSESHVDTFVRRLPAPRLFEWNLLNNDQARAFMLDFDGVLGVDPKAYDDDGAAYQSALRHAAPKYLSTFPIGWIATNRIERWRGITEDWLRRHGILLEHGLSMQPYETAAERRAHSTPAGFKARVYREAPAARLFIESHDVQAAEIHSLSGKPVLSIERMRVYQR